MYNGVVILTDQLFYATDYHEVMCGTRNKNMALILGVAGLVIGAIVGSFVGVALDFTTVGTAATAVASGCVLGAALAGCSHWVYPGG